MKIRVLLVNETDSVISSDGAISVSIEPGGAMNLYGAEAGWLASFGPGCWLSAVKVVDED